MQGNVDSQNSGGGRCAQLDEENLVVYHSGFSDETQEV